MCIAHRQRYLAASVSIYWGLGGSLEQHSMQISDMNLAFRVRVRVRDRVRVRVRVRDCCMWE